MNTLKYASRVFYRLLAVWFMDTLSLLITAALLPGFEIQGVEGRSALVVAAAAAFLLGIVNTLIRPVVLLLALPLGFIAVFVAGFFINTVISFVVTALAVFVVIKAVNRLKREEEAPPPPAPTDKECPYCFTKIPIKATRCPHCTSQLEA